MMVTKMVVMIDIAVMMMSVVMVLVVITNPREMLWSNK